LSDRKYRVEILSRGLREKSGFIFKKFESVKYLLNGKLTTLSYTLKDIGKNLDNSINILLNGFRKKLDWLNDYLNKLEKRLRSADPMRQLKLGYSITSIKGMVVRSVKQVKRGEGLDIQVSDGKIKSKVDNIINKI